MFQGKTNFRYYMGSLTNIDTFNNIIETDTGNLEYDILVLAMGTETNYFGIENMKRQALPMKTIDDALNFRNHILLNIEKVIRMRKSRTGKITEYCYCRRWTHRS